MKFHKTELHKQNATQNSMKINSWWSKCKSILGMVYPIVSIIKIIIKIVHIIQQLFL